MSYKKMMKWNKRHRKGTKQTVIMHTESGFQPSISFLDTYFKYREEGETKSVEPLSGDAYYKAGLRRRIE